jgi:hypothetical protein
MKIFGAPVLPLAAIFAGAALAQPDAQTLTGGVGLDDRERMMQRYRDYNLHLAFAETSGPYLAGVQVTARDEQGEVVLSSTADGPFLFTRLPPGSYRVTADFGGQARTSTIRVGDDAGRRGRRLRNRGAADASVAQDPRERLGALEHARPRRCR